MNRQRVLVGVVLVALLACKKKSTSSESMDFEPTPAVRTSAENTTPIVYGKPWPAGNVVAARTESIFAVYAMPSRNVDVLAAAKAVRRASYQHLPLLPVDTDKTGVVLLAPDIKKFAPPSEDMLKFSGRGLSPEQVKAVQGSEKLAVMSFQASGAEVLKVYADALKMVDAVADKTGGLIFDEGTRELFTRDAWKKRIEAPVSDPKNLSAHFTMHMYRNNGPLVRVVSIGLEKWGLPNLVVNDVVASTAGSMNALLNVVAATLFKQKKTTVEGALKVSADIADEKVLAGGTGAVVVSLVEAKKEEGDARGPLIEIAFPGPKATLHERHDKLLSTLFGAEDTLNAVKHTDAALAESAKARQRLLALKPRFLKGFGYKESLQVKAPFRTASGGNEWMWVEVSDWKGTTISGVLRNDPYDVPELKSGSKVSVEEASVFDYLHRKSDGTVEGNTTQKLLQKR